jgi:RNA polymerase sigma-70 factor, ECF subfamily
MNPRKELLEHIPNMRAFAMSLCGRADRADDLVQDTLMKAWTKLDTYEAGTNMRAWLFTILRNAFYSDLRKRKREVEDADGAMAATLATHPEQDGHMDFSDFRVALDKLPPDQREALILIGASGMSYEEAAEICDCAVGTVKSRVNRARMRLAEVLSIESAAEFGPDSTSQPIVTSQSTTRSVA